MKRVISILLAICMLTVLVGCLSKEDEQKYREIVGGIINEEIDDFYNGKNSTLNDYFDCKETKIEYTIDRIEKINDTNTDIMVSITYNIIADVSKENYTDTAISLIGFTLGQFFETRKVDDIVISMIGKFSDDKDYKQHYKVLLNNEEFFDIQKHMEEENTTSSNSKSGLKCKVCGKYFKPGDSGGNYMSIAKTGMCKNCYNNFQWGQKATGK